MLFTYFTSSSNANLISVRNPEVLERQVCININTIDESLDHLQEIINSHVTCRYQQPWGYQVCAQNL